MTEEAFQKLLEKYEEGLCSPQEEQLLERFLDSFQRPLDDANWSEQEQKEVGARIFKQINQQISISRRTTFFSKKHGFWWAIAAVIIGIGCYWAAQQFNKRKETGKDEIPIVYATLTTEENEQKKLKLNDGTLITINENSTLKYPTAFLATGVRRVELSGEAFFEVAKDSLRPFIAVSGSIETVVLGTSFNINASPKSEKIEVALIEGKVQINTIDEQELDVLQPNEQFIYYKKDKTAQKFSFKGNLTYAWKEDVILFEKASVEDVVKVLSEKYNQVFKIEQKEDIASLLVYRVDTEKYKLAQVLAHITRVTDYQFTKNADGSITVKPK